MAHRISYLLLALACLTSWGCGTTKDGEARTSSSSQRRGINVEGEAGSQRTDDDAQENAGEFWAVVIGVNRYLDRSIPNLHYSVSDAESVARTLVEYCGYKEDNILLMSDAHEAHRQPQRINLIQQIPKWLSRAESNDTVLVFFSGHGFLDDDGLSYVAPGDCVREELESYGLRTSTVRRWLQECKAARKLLVMDCCHAGGKAIGGRAPSSQRLSRDFREARGIITLASCREEQESIEDPRRGQGLFTAILTDGLSGAANTDGNVFVDSDELYKYVYQNVLLQAELLNFSQTPVRHIPRDTEGVFVVARIDPDKDPGKELRVLTTVCRELNNCKLILVAETGSNINLQELRKYTNEVTSDFCTNTLVGFNPGRHGKIIPKLQDGWLSWVAPLTMRWIEHERVAAVGPSDLSLMLRVAVHSDGRIQLGTYGPQDEEHLLVLTQMGGIDNSLDFFAGRLDQSDFDQPHNLLIETDEKQTLFGTWLVQLVGSLDKHRFASGGPTNGAELYDCPIRVLNRFSQPITVVHGRIQHYQFDYDWYLEGERPVDERTNEVWSPIALAPDQDAKLRWSCRLSYTGDNTTSAVHLRAACDNRNTAMFEASGMVLDDEPEHAVQGDDAGTVTIDRQRGTCTGYCENAATSEAILYYAAPTRIELSALSTWSVVQPSFRLATFATITVDEVDWSPKGQAKRDLRPQVWVLEPE